MLVTLMRLLMMSVMGFIVLARGGIAMLSQSNWMKCLNWLEFLAFLRLPVLPLESTES